ncbi:PEPxxWA-CTERM sorting domain-containing protein [Sphingomonas sp.]|uniref:PEPxxWA-CTERM sorting domain-containing protein n=1 Tax=Sphingomonas sp. TaxID=28214 RepID=UPI0025E31650|nr:PEPxxWA-CTERM sorting domain-containing protein [Sphingomonas sp.]
MKISGWKLLSAGVTATLASSAASAATFTFSLTNQGNQSASAYNDLTFTSTSGGNTITMDVYGAHMNDATVSGNSALNTVTASTVAVWSGYGLGVLYGNDNTGNETHQIDNVGGGVDFVVLSFSQAVTLSSYTTKAWAFGNNYSTDSDTSFMAYNGSLADLLGGVNRSAFSTVNNSGGTNTTNTGSSVTSAIWLVGAAVGTSDRDDGFKLTSLSINAVPATVPEPATWAMMLVGFGAIGGTMRSRKVRQSLNVTFGA